MKDMLAARLPRARGCSLLALGALVALLIGFMRVVWRLAHLEERHRWGAVPPAPDMAGGPAIPKVIHQMYQSEQLPAQWRNGSAAWKQLHPDYRYVLWTDASLRELIAAEVPADAFALYDGYPHATQRWDASRYAILHHHGGLYADLDLRPVRRVDGLLRGQHALLPHTAEHRADERANGVDAPPPILWRAAPPAASLCARAVRAQQALEGADVDGLHLRLGRLLAMGRGAQPPAARARVAARRPKSCRDTPPWRAGRVTRRAKPDHRRGLGRGARCA